MNWPLYRKLHARGMTQEKLAKIVGTSRPHLCEVLANKPGHGHLTRRKLFEHLTDDEIELLGWTNEHEKWKQGKTSLACST